MHKHGALTTLRAMEACVPGLRFLQFRGPKDGIAGKGWTSSGSSPSVSATQAAAAPGLSLPGDALASGRGSDTLLPKAILTRRVLPIDLPHYYYVIGAVVPPKLRNSTSEPEKAQEPASASGSLNHEKLTRRDSCFTIGGGVDNMTCRTIEERVGLCLDESAHRLDDEGHVCFDDGRRVLSKIVDFGNACWVTEHFTDDIQTRQYRSPEVIIGAGYDASADIWSYGCLVFELLTGDILFDPRTRPNATYTRDEDHVSLMVEMMGNFDRKFVLTGKQSKAFFNKKGQLKEKRKLRPCSVEKLLLTKYSMSPDDAAIVADFLEKCLQLNPADRWKAGQLLTHPWFADVRNGELTQ